MFRCAICVVLASALAFPAHALTFDPRNGFEESVYDLVGPERAAPGGKWVRPGFPGADKRSIPVAESGGIFIVPTAGSGHLRNSRKGLFAGSGAGPAVGRTNAEFDPLWALLRPTAASAPRLRAPLTPMGSATPSFVRATSAPLPPNLSMFATALAFALLFARRHVGFTGPRYQGRSKSGGTTG